MFGILIVEDLIAILLLTILTTISSGEELSALEFGRAVGQLAAFLAIVMVVGLLVVPRLVRAVVRLDRAETTVVASVGIAFGFALLAATFGYSVALGAFLAGALVAESGVEKTVEHLVQPVRDIFAAIFFVSVGMLIDPVQIAVHWQVVLVFLVAVIIGKIFSVTVGAFLTGQGVQNSVKTGMSLAQIGEFSFIIAGVGLATGATDRLLYSMAVAVSAITTLLTPWLIRISPATAAWIDRKLPRSLQTFGALYASWLEKLGTSPADEQRLRIRGAIRWLIVDAVVVAAIVIGASVEMDRVAQYLASRFDLSKSVTRPMTVAGAAILVAPFAIGMVRVARYLGLRPGDSRVSRHRKPAARPGGSSAAVAGRHPAIGDCRRGRLAAGGGDAAVPSAISRSRRFAISVAAPRRTLLAQRDEHARPRAGRRSSAGRRAAQQTRAGRAAADAHSLDDINHTLAGLGSPVPITLAPGNPNIGKTLAEVKLRGLTGATVLAIQRGEQSVLIPSGHERLESGDVLAIAGTHSAVEAAQQILSAGDSRA